MLSPGYPEEKRFMEITLQLEDIAVLSQNDTPGGSPAHH